MQSLCYCVFDIFCNIHRREVPFIHTQSSQHNLYWRFNKVFAGYSVGFWNLLRFQIVTNQNKSFSYRLIIALISTNFFFVATNFCKHSLESITHYNVDNRIDDFPHYQKIQRAEINCIRNSISHTILPASVSVLFVVRHFDHLRCSKMLSFTGFFYRNLEIRPFIECLEWHS